MMEYTIRRTSSEELYHHGIKGQKWGERRFQNPDGSYTKEGKERYNKKYRNEDGSMTEAGLKKYEKALKTAQGEKISGKQMARNAVRRGAIGASVGGAIGGIKAHNDAISSLNKNFENKMVEIPQDISAAMDQGKITLPGRARINNSFSFAYPGSKGESYNTHYAELPVMDLSTPSAITRVAKFTSTLLNGPASIVGGTAIGAGVGALGSVTVDSIHNLKIDRAKKFVEKYKDAFEKTYVGGKA